MSSFTPLSFALKQHIPKTQLHSRASCGTPQPVCNNQCGLADALRDQLGASTCESLVCCPMAYVCLDARFDGVTSCCSHEAYGDLAKTLLAGKFLPAPFSHYPWHNRPFALTACSCYQDVLLSCCLVDFANSSKCRHWTDVD